jgi:hypothetical protein
MYVCRGRYRHADLLGAACLRGAGSASVCLSARPMGMRWREQPGAEHAAAVQQVLSVLAPMQLATGDACGSRTMAQSATTLAKAMGDPSGLIASLEVSVAVCGTTALRQSHGRASVAWLRAEARGLGHLSTRAEA